jgi:hypothetical protein
LIGEPVAFTPGLGPHEERPAAVLLPPPLVLEPVLEPVLDPALEVVAPPLADVVAPALADVVAPPDELLLLLLDPLLPQPASTKRVSDASTARQALILGTVK